MADFKHEKINYIELPSSDLEKTKAFYGGVFGWSFQNFGEEYVAFSGAGLDGGFFLADLSSSTVNGAALVVLYSVSLEQTLEKVAQAGGEVVKDIFSFPGGRRFHFTDLTGNELAVWSDL